MRQFRRGRIRSPIAAQRPGCACAPKRGRRIAKSRTHRGLFDWHLINHDIALAFVDNQLPRGDIYPIHLGKLQLLQNLQLAKGYHGPAMHVSLKDAKRHQPPLSTRHQPLPPITLSVSMAPMACPQLLPVIPPSAHIILTPIVPQHHQHLPKLMGFDASRMRDDGGFQSSAG